MAQLVPSSTRWSDGESKVLMSMMSAGWSKEEVSKALYDKFGKTRTPAAVGKRSQELATQSPSFKRLGPGNARSVTQETATWIESTFGITLQASHMLKFVDEVKVTKSKKVVPTTAREILNLGTKEIHKSDVDFSACVAIAYIKVERGEIEPRKLLDLFPELTKKALADGLTLPQVNKVFDDIRKAIG
jgi:hypothetical protein